MVQLIVGVKGEGKTKKMLEHVHNILASTDGNVVYLDKSTQNMHELDNRVRLINVTEYPIQNTDQFIGFVCGICSQDYDLQEIYLDGSWQYADHSAIQTGRSGYFFHTFSAESDQ